MTDYEDYQEHLMQVFGFERLEFHAHRGDVVVWASNVVHGGASILTPGSTRRSQVTHYFFDGCVYYTPMRSDLIRGELYVRHGMTDIRTGSLARQTLDDRDVQMVVLSNRRTRLLVDPTPPERLLAAIGNALRGFPLQRVRLGMRLIHRGRAARERVRLRRARQREAIV
jgi:hypothetical protein